MLCAQFEMSHKDEGITHPHGECYDAQFKMSNTDECHCSKPHQDARYVFGLKWEIKMSASVANTLRMHAMCLVQNKQ